MTRLRVEVPASSANLGPGFDCLALALDLVDIVTVDLALESSEVVLLATQGEATDLDPVENLLCRAYRAWGHDADRQLPGARFSLESRIPVGKGFGSSAASLVAGLATAAFACGDNQPRDRMLRLAAALEGHADNVAAATLGGVTTAFCDGEEVHALHLANHLSLGVSLFVPRDTLPTEQARAALPRRVPLADAVFDIGRSTYLVTALIWGRWELIGPAMQDRIHQPYRARLIPGMEAVIAAATESGAYGAALSGGGPSVIALGPRERAAEVAAAMERAARDARWEGNSLVSSIRAQGVRVEKQE
ncbi:MAG TPA: homoserine kinase [Chloroflexota bacterium]|nr:homoserine kinase [Chloroflexota bacterium]